MLPPIHFIDKRTSTIGALNITDTTHARLEQFSKVKVGGVDVMYTFIMNFQSFNVRHEIAK